MPRYDFVSPGAVAGNAIQQFLVQREMQKRQQMLDELAQQKQAEELRLRGEDLSLRRAQEERVAEQQRAAAEELATERGFRRATTIAAAAVPGDPTDEATAALLREHGYGSQVQTGPPTQGPLLSEDESGIPTYAVAPGVLQLRGGSQYLSARAAADERKAAATEAAAARAAEAATNREFRGEQSQADRDMRELIARMSASNSTETRALANQLTQLRIDAEREKLETARTTREKGEADARSATQSALDLATRLETHPGIGAGTGAYEMRGFTQGARDFTAIKDQLIASLTLPNLGALKGPMSDKDVVFVKQLATRLASPGLSEGETHRAITEAKTFLQSKLSQADTPQGDMGRGEGQRETPEARRKRLYDELSRR